MKRPNWPGLERRVSRHGKTCWYVRIEHGPRERLRADPSSPEFRVAYEAAYAALAKGEKLVATKSKVPSTGTLAWLWEQFMRSSAWLDLSNATKRQRENIMKHVLEGAGDMPFALVTRKMIIEGRERRAATPSQSNCYLKLMRQLFAWAVEVEHLTVNPAADVKLLDEKTKGFPEWTDEDEARFIARWPKGTRQYLAYMVHASTGLRRSDAVRLTRNHFGKDGKIHLTAKKNGVELHIPIHQDLADAIAACPPSGMFILETSQGRPWVVESYGNTFHDWTVEAEVVEAGKPKNSHGIRKLAATRVCEAGATPHQMMALFGWKSVAMAEVYTKARDQKHLAGEAGAKVGAVGVVIPFPATGS